MFPFVIMFIVAAITTQRERARGTLERLMAMPLGKLDLLAGYGIAFGLMACVQVTLVLVVSLTWLGVTVPGSAVPMAVVAVLDAVLGMACGLFASAFARTEFQAVQFMPAFVLPQALLCGLVVPRDHMTAVLRWLSDILPLSYAVDAMQRITASASWTSASARTWRSSSRSPPPPWSAARSRCGGALRDGCRGSRHRFPDTLQVIAGPGGRGML